MLKAASGIFAHATHGKGALLRGTSLAAYFHEGLTCKSSQEAPSAEQETVNYDVCIVGAGPAGLAAAIRFKQLCKENDKDYTVCIVEKGAEVGAHILSGNVLQPTALNELIPDWKEDETCPVGACLATKDRFYLLTRSMALRLPVPPQMKNKGNYVVSLSEVVRWLGTRAEALGVEIYPGFAAARALLGPDGSIGGVVTNDVGVAKDGSHKDTYAPGMALASKVTLVAEGCRGSLAGDVMKRFNLRESVDADPQTYGLGVKEVWEVNPEMHKPGTVWHTVGWPLPSNVYGGGWLYHMDNNRVSLGMVVGLDYSNPSLSPYEEFQQFKRHPAIAKLLRGGTCLQYGARSLTEGGLQSIPALSFPGGALIGDSAGLLNVPKIKGTHTAMKSGMLAAEAAFKALNTAKSPGATADLSSYEDALHASWVHTELHSVRNVRPGFSHFGGLWGGVAHAAVDTYLLRGKAPWTFHHRRADHETLLPAAECTPREYPRPDGELTFDLATSLHRSGTNHDHDQPSHLRLRNTKLPAVVNLAMYGGPEANYCPAGVYEYVLDEVVGDGAQKLQINAQNCLHCKACDIKDPTQNIEWTPPEGGGGPAYTHM